MLIQFVSENSTARMLLRSWLLGRHYTFTESVDEADAAGDDLTANAAHPGWLKALMRAHRRGHLANHMPGKPALDIEAFKAKLKTGLREMVPTDAKT